jgi:hypothetical protein
MEVAQDGGDAGAGAHCEAAVGDQGTQFGEPDPVGVESSKPLVISSVSTGVICAGVIRSGWPVMRCWWAAKLVARKVTTSFSVSPGWSGAVQSLGRGVSRGGRSGGW